MELEFLDNHLLRWFPRLRSTVEEWARLDFYRAVVRLTERFLVLDRSYLSQLLEELKEAGESRRAE